MANDQNELLVFAEKDNSKQIWRLETESKQKVLCFELACFLFGFNCAHWFQVVSFIYNRNFIMTFFLGVGVIITAFLPIKKTLLLIEL